METYEIPKWSISNFGGVLHIDDYANMPTEVTISLDLETNGKEPSSPDFKIVCVGICGDGANAYVFFDIRPELIEYLRECRFIAHDGKGAEIPWLNKLYGGFSIEQLYFDTKTGYYTYDSTRKNYSLKPILEGVFGIKYPTYSEIVGNPSFVAASCEVDPTLYVTRRTKTTKKNPEGVGQKLPKEVTLDKMPRWVVAEYNACDVLWTHRLWTWLRQHFTGSQKKYFRHIEMPETRLIYHMERKGIKIDTQAVRKIHNQQSKARRAAHRKFISLAEPLARAVMFRQIAKLETELAQAVGEPARSKGLAARIMALKERSTEFKKNFNINSWQQVLPILQETIPGISATDEDTLNRYPKSELISALLEYRGFQKICSTYTSPLYFNAIKSDDRRIHARFSQNTITGRLSSSNPINLQNQPQDVRECFVAEGGYVFINADWSNIELRIPAHLSGEPRLIAEFHKPAGEDDVHRVTAGLIYGSSVYSLPEAEYQKRRKIAKTCNFLLTNSGTADRLAAELRCSKEEATEIYKKFWQGYSVLASWLAWEKRQARFVGGIGTWFGRWVKIPQLRLSCEKPWLCGRPFADKTTGEPRMYTCRNCIVRQEAERTAMSVRVQGTAADMCKMAALRLWREYGYIPNLKVHDELNYEEPIDTVETVKQRVKYVMENVAALKVPLVVDVAAGNTWKEAHK